MADIVTCHCIWSRPAAKTEHADHVNLYPIPFHTLCSPGPLPVVRQWKKMYPWMITLLIEKSTFMPGIKDLLQLYMQHRTIRSFPVKFCFAQLSKALLGSIRLVNLEQCTTSLCVQEFDPLSYQPYAWY